MKEDHLEKGGLTSDGMSLHPSTSSRPRSPVHVLTVALEMPFRVMTMVMGRWKTISET